MGNSHNQTSRLQGDSFLIVLYERHIETELGGRDPVWAGHRL